MSSVEEQERDSHFATKEDDLYSLFDSSACRFGNRNCLLRVKNSKSVAFSYEEVSHRVHRLGDSIHFPRHRFIGIVGYDLSPEIVVCILGILEAGAAFIFLNAAESEIATSCVEQLRIRDIIGEESVVGEFANRRWTTPFNLAKTVDIFEEKFAVWHRDRTLAVEVDAISSSTDSSVTNVAFAALSSGSTKNVPKLIKVPHRSILPNILDLNKMYELEPTDTVLVTTPLTFDPCIHDIFLAFSRGCCVLMADAITMCEGELVGRLFDPDGYNATVFFTTPSMFRKWRLPAGRCSLRILILGGEPFPPIAELRDAFSRAIRIYNIYGITQVSCWSSVFRVPPNHRGAVPLGSALSGTVFEVRDDQGRVIDDGIGELFIGSTSRICAVDDDSEPEPIDESRPRFRSTGDLVEITAGTGTGTGTYTYYFVGRKDRRVKLFGHQVDLTLIENRISTHSSVKNCSVFTDDVEIVALVETNETAAENLTAATLKTFVSGHLPAHMLPNDIRFVSQLPLGSHGKVSSSLARALYERMVNPEDVRRRFARLWTAFTARSCLNEERGFLDSGGSSFGAVQFNAALERITEVPRNFIQFLVANKNFSQCFGLISDGERDTAPSNAVHTVDKRINAPLAANILDEKKSTDSGYPLIGVSSKGRGRHRGGSALSIGDKIIRIEWRYDMEKCVDSSPTLLVFDDRVLAVCGSHSGWLLVVEVGSGNIVSKIKLPHRIESSACPDTDGRRFFIGCYDGNMYAVDVVSASILWRYSTNDIVKSTAVLFDDKLFFGSYDRNFHCISSEDGALVWKVNVDDSAIYATAVVRSDAIVCATLAGTIAFIDHNGTVKKSVTDFSPIFSDPIEIPGQNMVVVVDVNGSMRCFDLDLYSELWRDGVRGCVFSSLSPMGSDPVKIVFGSQSGAVTCFEVSRIVHRKLWERKIGEQTYATPFCCETWNAVVAVSTDGDVRILEADSGHVSTSYSIKAPVFSSPVAFANNIVVGSRDNFLYSLKVVSKL